MIKCRKCEKMFHQKHRERICPICNKNKYIRRKDRVFETISYEKLMTFKKELNKMKYEDCI